MISKAFYGYLLSFISISIGFSFYVVGFDAINWDKQFEDVFVAWDFWKYFSALVISAMLLLSTALEYMLFIKKNHEYTRLHFLLSAFSMIYFLILMAHELFILAFCDTFTEIIFNDVRIPVPYYPHCINEDYPRNTDPSYGFLCRYFGIGCIVVSSIATYSLCYTYFKSISKPLEKNNKKPE